MKIISKFKDYYDTVSHQYLDKEVLYVRDTVIHKLKDRVVILSSDTKTNKENTHFSFYFEYIGFCGEVYPVIQVKYFNKDQQKEIHVGLYNSEEVYGFFQQHGLKIEINKYYYRYLNSISLNTRAIEEFFKDRESAERLMQFFSKYNTPVFILRRQDGNQVVEVNPQLKPYYFSRVKDPFTAHQDLYRYITSVMIKPDRPMVQLTDKDRIAKHGFDKFSFRKEKSKK